MTHEEQISYLKAKIALYRYDYLTGLKMRRDFDYELRQQFSTGEVFYLVYYDIIGLHNTNRTYGFAAGDRLIRQVAADIQGKGDNQTVYRHSGDEFYAVCLSSPTGNVINASRVWVKSSCFQTVDAMLGALDTLMIKEKSKNFTRRIDDL